MLERCHACRAELARKRGSGVNAAERTGSISGSTSCSDSSRVVGVTSPRRNRQVAAPQNQPRPVPVAAVVELVSILSNE